MMSEMQRQRTEPMERLTRVVASSRQKQSLVDPRGLGKPNTYDSDQKKWATWSFKTVNYFTAVFAEARRMLEIAEDAGEDEITAWDMKTTLATKLTL